MTYKIIATGSGGNAVLLNGCILIDCGVSMKKLEPFLRDLRLVLLTHIHGDHFKKATIRAIAKARPALRWGCCEWLAGPLMEAGVDPRMIDVFRPIDGETEFLYPTIGIRVRPVELTHNVQNCGYHIHTMDMSEKAFYATDTGSLDGIEARGYRLYLVEANHKEDEIQARIAAKQAAGESFIYEVAAAKNHMSYEKTTAWLQENMGPDSVWVQLHQHKEESHEKSDA